MQLTLYTKPGCHLCDDLKIILLNLQDEVTFTVAERDITSDPELVARFQYLIPVLEIPGGPLLYPPHREDHLRRALSALGSTPTSYSP
jgi:thiol-disulfide isomerase/thioredoxin